MEDMIPCPVKDREVFQRVWQRVMEGRDQAAGPIQAVSPDWSGDVSCECLEALARQQGEGSPGGESQGGTAQPTQGEGCPARQEAPVEPEPSLREPADMESGWQPAEDMPAPERPAPEGDCAQEGLPPRDGAHLGSDLPPRWEEPQPADDRTARLRRHVMDALEGWQFYRHLSKRTRGADARTLNNMAGELHREARKLSAAYFLLTGLRYWPTELLGAPAIPSYWGALRTRHQAEQRQDSAYRLAADDWDDGDILALYNGLADACQQRCRRLRSLLEQTIT